MSKKEQRAEAYVNVNIPDREKRDYTYFNEYDLKEAFEEGWTSAMEEAYEWLENNLVKETYIICGGYVHVGFEGVLKKFKSFAKN